MGAASTSFSSTRDQMGKTASPTPLVELLVFDGCPNADAARELIDRVSASLALSPQVDVVVVRDTESAERARFSVRRRSA
jgi:hypothetical protein